MFIELTKIGQYNYSAKTLINSDNIICVRTHPDTGAIVETTEGVWIVEESYDDIKKMLTSVPVIINTSTGEIDQLFKDADKGICSNDYYVPLNAEDMDAIDKMRVKLFSKLGVPLKFMMKEE